MRILRGPVSHTRVWNGSSWVCCPRAIFKAALVAAGVATFYLTDDGTAGGKAIFRNVYKPSTNFWVDDANAPYMFGGWALSGDKKTLTINVKQSAGIVIALLGLTLLGVPTNAANGTEVNLSIWGDFAP